MPDGPQVDVSNEATAAPTPTPAPPLVSAPPAQPPAPPVAKAPTVDVSDEAAVPPRVDVSDEQLTPEALQTAGQQHAANIASGDVHATLDEAKNANLAGMGGRNYYERVWDQLKQLPDESLKALAALRDKAAALYYSDPKVVLQDAGKYIGQYVGQQWQQAKEHPFLTLAEEALPPNMRPSSLVPLETGTAKLVGGAGARVVEHVHNALQMPPGYGGEEVTPEATKEYNESQAKWAGWADIVNGVINRGSDEVARATGQDPKSLQYQTVEMIPGFLPIGGGEFLSSEGIAKLLSRMAQAGSPVVRAGLAATPEVAVGAATYAAAHALHIPAPLIEAGAAMTGVSLTRRIPAAIAKNIAKRLGEMAPAEVAGNVKLTLDAPNGVRALEDWQKVVSEAINKRSDQVQGLMRKLDPEDLGDLNARRPNGEYLYDAEDLSGTAKQIRAKQQEIDDLTKKLDQSVKQTEFRKWTNATGAYVANIAANTAIAGGIGGAFGALAAPTGQGAQGFASGAMFGGSIGAALSPFAAYSGMHNLRLSRARASLIDAGSRGFDMSSLEGVPDELKNRTLIANGYARAMGGQIKVVDPAMTPDWPGAVPQLGEPEVAPTMMPQKAMPANGFIDEGSNTLYLNKNALGEGTAYHELRHLMQRFTGQMLRLKSPEIMEPFEQAYAEASGNRRFNLQAEMDAEIGRIAMMHTPLEAFYGGKRPGDVVARMARGIADYFVPERRGLKYDDTLKVPYTRADIEKIRDQMFDLGPRVEARRFVEPVIEGAPPAAGAPPTGPPTGGGAAPPPTALSGGEQQVLQNVLAGSRRLGGVGASPSDVGNAIVAAKQAGVEVNESNILNMVLNQANGRDPFHGILPPETAAPPPETAPKVPVTPAGVTVKPPPVTETAPTVTHPDYSTIRSQAEDAMRQKLAGSKAKDVEARIGRAGLEAAAQAHAQAVGPDTDLITWRTDKFGKSSIWGTRADPRDPFHQLLIDRANLSPEAKTNLNDLEANMGRAIAVDYSHAPGEGEGVTRAEREAARAEAGAPERVAGEVAREKLTKSFVPTGIRYSPKSNVFMVDGFSPDKLLGNANVVIDWAKDQGKRTYADVNDPLLAQHIQQLTENHQNGYTGAGKPIKGTALTPVEQTPGYEPHVIPRDYLDQINVMMGNDTAKTGVKGLSPEQAEKQLMAKQNSPYFDPTTGETNKVRSQMGERAKELSPVYETLRPELIDRVRQAPVEDEQTLRPSGFTGDRGQFGLKGLPRQEFVAAGLMPATGLKPEYRTDEASARVSPSGYISNLFVRPGARGMGEGSALMRQIMVDADKAGTSLKLHIGEQRDDLRGFYERLGFKETGRDQFGIRYEREPQAQAPAQLMPATGFYTKSGQIVEQKMPNAADSEQVKALLRNNGVGKNEMEWLGLNDLPKGKMTKDEMRQWIDAHTPEISVTQLGGDPTPAELDKLTRLQARRDELDQRIIDREAVVLQARGDELRLGRELKGMVSPELFETSPQGELIPRTQPTPDQLQLAKQKYNDAINYRRELERINADEHSELWKLREEQSRLREARPRTQYQQYTLPGGENYREILIKSTPGPLLEPQRAWEHTTPTLNMSSRGGPMASQPTDVWETAVGGAGEGGYHITRIQKPSGDAYAVDSYGIPGKYLSNAQFASLEEAKAAVEADLLKRPLTRGAIRQEPGYTSPHFGAEGENLIGHLRTTDRTTAGGNKMLFLEEAQSDWGQQIREKGAGKINPEDLKVSYNESRGGWDIVNPRTGDKRFFSDARRDPRAFYRNLDEAKNAAAEVFSEGAVPDMPFKGEAWKKLLLRQGIKTAVEEGKDSIGWTTGAQQAERYNLAKHVSVVQLKGRGDGTFDIAVARPNQLLETLADAVPYRKLPDYIGKELASRVTDEKSAEYHRFRDLDLQIGGEGMKGFYDKELVNIANDIGKKYGARVQDAQLGPGRWRMEGKIADAPNAAWGSAGDFEKETTRAEMQSLVEEYQKLYPTHQWRVVQAEPGETVHELPITPQMRDSVQTSGQPMFMPATGERAQLFYSPNETDLDFDQALVALRSPRQTYANDVGRNIDDALGLNAVYHDAIGDTKTYGAENSVVSEMSNIKDIDELRYAAALRGRDLNQKSVLAFLEHEGGEHTLYSLTVPERDLSKIRTQLDDAGLEFRTLVPREDGTRVQIFSRDPEADKKALQKFTNVYNESGHDIEIQHTEGTGEFVGEADTREEAQRNYAKIIQDYEGRYPLRPRGPAQGPRPDYSGRTREVTGQQQLMPATGMTETPSELREKAWAEIARYLTPEQLGTVADRFRDRIVEPYLKLDSDFGRSLLYTQKGALGRKWYGDFVDSIHAMLGSDHPDYARDPERFAAVMAALSPNRSVDEDLQHALSAWAMWEEQGRPQDKASIENILHETVPVGASTTTEELRSSLPAWINNAHRAFTAEDPTAIRLSGPKVNAFYRNLIGDVHAVTVDRHMAIFGYGSPKVGARRVKIGGEQMGIESFMNLAMQAHIRKVADVMTRISGETWTPAEVQAAIWTYQLPVQDLADKLGVTVQEFLGAGRDVPPELLKATPSAKLFQSERSQATIKRLQGLREKNIGGAGEARAGAGGESQEISGETGEAQPRRGETPFRSGGIVYAGIRGHSANFQFPWGQGNGSKPMKGIKNYAF